MFLKIWLLAGGMDKGNKGFQTWHQFVSMLFAQLADSASLREINLGLGSASGKLRHLGLTAAPCRSTLSYANAHRPWRFYEDLFYKVYEMVAEEAGKNGKKFRFKNPLYSLDSSTIELCLNVYDWARFRRTKGAIKLHMLLNNQGCLPCWALITDGKCADIKAARLLEMRPGSIVVMDRGYNDFELFDKWCRQGVFFVTRMKDNTLYEVSEVLETPERSNVLSDEVIRLTGATAVKTCPNALRRVTVWDEKQQRELVFITNIHHLAGSTIGMIYRQRWEIEIFFKALKQNLRIKTFLGTNENAVRTQIWTALIAILLMMYLRMRAKWSWSLSQLVATFRTCMFAHKELWDWLANPLPKSEQNLPQRYGLFPN